MLCYGHLLYVEEKDELKSKWLWATVLVTLPFHVALFGIIVAIDRMAPSLASKPIVFLFVIWAVGWLESRLMDQIADDYRPWGAVTDPLAAAGRPLRGRALNSPLRNRTQKCSQRE